jgi:hypothetical protein
MLAELKMVVHDHFLHTLARFETVRIEEPIVALWQ